MKIKKLGEIKETFDVIDEMVFSGNVTPTICGILTSLDYPRQEESVDIKFSITIDISSVEMRNIWLTFSIPKTLWQRQRLEPVRLSPEKVFTQTQRKYHGLFLFVGSLFLMTTDYISDNSEEIAQLKIKRLVLSEDSEVERLKKEVAALKSISEQTESYTRKAIPDVVKLIVFGRDHGQCVRCGSKEKLHFDHIIPVSKGGGDSEENIQLLCGMCNLKKSDKLAF